MEAVDNSITNMEQKSMTSKKQGRPKNNIQNRRNNCFDWGGYLTKVEAVPVTSFKHCSLSNAWNFVGAGLKVEVALGKHECSMDEKVYWIATVIRQAGYKSKLRYEGFGLDDSHDFWVDLCSVDVHAIGWCATHGKKLVPPSSLAGRRTDWESFLLKRLTDARTLPSNLYSEFRQSGGDHRFRKGMILELVDKMCIAAMKVARIIDTVDGRLHLLYEGGGGGDSNDFWCHKNSPLIHPVGWSSTVGHRLHASPEYIQSAQIKSASQKYDPNDCTPDMFLQVCKTEHSDGFLVGMKLEAVDPLNLSNICVATVMKVLKHNFLMIGIDGYMDTRHGNDWFCYHASSACILPVGFCEINGIPLTPPKGYDTPFLWKDYLHKTRSIAAPVRLFNCEVPEHSFREGLKLEAVDLMDPRLICVATVEQVVGRLVRIGFDGWEATFDQWVDCESPDIYPAGWCELMKYALEGPKEGLALPSRHTGTPPRPNPADLKTVKHKPS